MIDSIRMEDTSCPLNCPKSDKAILTGYDRIHNLPGEFTVVKCNTCGLMRTNPRPTADTISAYYPSDYGPYLSVNTAAAKSVPSIKQKVKHLLGLDSRLMPSMPVGRLLEIGCASGSYLELMRDEGWSVEGIEFSEIAAKQARDNGFSVQVATVESAKDPIEPVDVVSAWMVLEHLHEPVLGLRKMRTWVRQEGYLVASIPDAGCLQRRIFGGRWYDLHLPNHLFHFTPKTIEKVLANAGWQLERVFWQRNCNNLLRSIEYFARDNKYNRLEKAIGWFRTSSKVSKLRAILGWVLGVTRQSGRMEIWARPMSVKEGSI